jgi:hypothetical protein
MSTDGGVDEGADKGVRILSFGTHFISSQDKGGAFDRATIDSGGPGTYSQLIIVKEYMVRLASDLGIDEKDVYPADYFDLMGGVGFGGCVLLYIKTLSYHPSRLVAILLGHLRMNVDEAIEVLLDVAVDTFPDNSPNLDNEIRTRQLGESVKSILQTRGMAPDMKMQDISEKSARCKVYV